MNIINARKQKWNDFYSGSIPSLVLVGHEEPERPMPYAKNKSKRIKWSIERCLRQMDMLEKLNDDSIPFLSPYTGTEIFAHAFGAKIYESDDNMPACLPVIHSSAELARLKTPKLESSSLMEIFDIADALRAAVPDGLMALPDIQSPLDIAALVWAKEEFLIAMYDDPQAVHEITAMTNELLINFLDMWFERYGKEFIAHYPDYYMPYGITLSEDEIGTISTDMFREYTAGILDALSERYGGIGIHCCANSRHQWKNLMAVKGLKLINLIQPPDLLDAAYEEFSHVCAQMHSQNPRFPNKHSADGLFRGRIIWQATANSEESAIEQCKILREMSEKYMAD